MNFWDRVGKDETLMFLLFIVLKQKNKFVIIALNIISITDFQSKAAACSMPVTDVILQRSRIMLSNNHIDEFSTFH